MIRTLAGLDQERKAVGDYAFARASSCIYEGAIVAQSEIIYAQDDKDMIPGVSSAFSKALRGHGL